MCRRRCAAFDRLPSCLHRSREAPFFRRLGALAVQDGGAGTLLATSGQSGLGPKSIVDSRPSAIQAPGTKVVVDRLAARKLVGQVAPGASRAQCIEDAVDDLAQVHLPRTSSRLGWRKQWLQRLPLRIRKIAGVRLSLHTQSLPQSLPLFRHTLRDSAPEQVRLRGGGGGVPPERTQVEDGLDSRKERIVGILDLRMIASGGDIPRRVRKSARKPLPERWL